MLDSDTPLIEDFNAAIRYCVMVRDQLLKFRDVEIPEALQVVTMWGIRHAERTAADAVHRMLRCVAADVDGVAPEAFDALLEQLKAPGSKRPAFLSDRSLQQILFLRNIAMAAGFACLTEVAQLGIHETLTDLTSQLANGLLEAAEEAGIPLVVNHVGGMFGIFFTEAKTVTCYQDVVKCDVERFKRFFHMMLDEGVYLAPSAFEAGFMSVAHSMEDINNTIDAARRVFAKL